MTEPLTFDHYYPYEELTRHLRALAERRPDLMTVESIGKSYEGRDIWLATVTNSATGPASDKPAFWADGNIHATEVSAASACLYFLNRLLTEYGRDPDITRALDTRAFYVVPRVNPDGAELFFADPTCRRFLRSSTRPYPYDEEPIEGLKRCDVDGDGRFLTMRIVDPSGPWKAHPDEPRLLVSRDPAEAGGTYYRLLPEGLLENWDGFTLTVQPNREGLDLNRNFPANWRQEHEQGGAGPYPTSEPEVNALVAFITAHPNICLGVTFHTYTGVLLRPYSTKSDEEFAAEDLWTYQAIGKKGTEITGYPNVSVFHDFKYHPKEVITGDWDEWMFEHQGVFAWTVEIWSPQRQAGIIDYKFIEWFREHPFEDDLKMLRWSDEQLDGQGYVDWYAFHHPQLGRVELGGWDAMHAFRNPPPKFIEKEVALFPDWLVWQALVMPKLEIAALEAAPIGEGEERAYRVRLVVDNTGWLPTYVSKRAAGKKTMRGVVAEIALPAGAELLTGKPREQLGQLEGRTQKGPAPYGWTADPTEQRLKVEWTLRARPGQTVQVTARHERAGTVRGEVRLE